MKSSGTLCLIFIFFENLTGQGNPQVYGVEDVIAIDVLGKVAALVVPAENCTAAKTHVRAEVEKGLYAALCREGVVSKQRGFATFPRYVAVFIAKSGESHTEGKGEVDDSVFGDHDFVVKAPKGFSERGGNGLRIGIDKGAGVGYAVYVKTHHPKVVEGYPHRKAAAKGGFVFNFGLKKMQVEFNFGKFERIVGEDPSTQFVTFGILGVLGGNANGYGYRE